MQLTDGALAIAGDLPRAACTLIDVPAEAGEEQGTGVRRYSTLERVRALVAQAAGDNEQVVVVGGDSSVALGALEALADAETAVLWLGAHPALHSPDTSPTSALHEMTLRCALGEGAPGLAADPNSISAGRVVLAGARDFDVAEQVIADELNIRSLSVDELADVPTALRSTGASKLYIHVDLDVLDPAAISGLSRPVPFGAVPEMLVSTIRAARAELPLIGASIAEFSPASPAAAEDDLSVVLRVIGALA
nr:arginase family protein [Microbacterium halimionae]